MSDYACNPKNDIHGVEPRLNVATHAEYVLREHWELIGAAPVLSLRVQIVTTRFY
jgi:hypothetical protein